MLARNTMNAVGAVGLAVLMAGCTMSVDQVKQSATPGGEWEAVFTSPPQGNTFTEALARDYKVLAVFENDMMFDYLDADTYAKRSLMAEGGEAPEPFVLSDWNLPEDHIPALTEARATIESMFAQGVRENYPAEAARLQTSYDCWVEQQEENHQFDHIALCREHFNEALANLRTAMAPKPEPEPVPAAAPPPQPTFADSYVVYFPFDSSELSATAMTTLGEVVEALQSLNAGASIIGHTDTSGPPAYNQALSERRANAVTDILLDAGIRPAVVTTEGRGEEDLAVPTEDGVREERNRRAVINIR